MWKINTEPLTVILHPCLISIYLHVGCTDQSVYTFPNSTQSRKRKALKNLRWDTKSDYCQKKNINQFLEKYFIQLNFSKVVEFQTKINHNGV